MCYHTCSSKYRAERQVRPGKNAHHMSIRILELHILRDILMHKYGRDFSAAVMENRDGCVSERVCHRTLARVKILTMKLPGNAQA